MDPVAIFIVSAIACLAYVLPWIIAAARNHHNTDAIAVLNLLLGWTFIGWAIGLVWALTEVRPPAEYFDPYEDEYAARPRRDDIARASDAEWDLC